MLPQTFQSEDAIAQGIHNVIQCGFIRHIEEVFIVGITGDVLDLRDERLWVLLPADVMTENLEPSVGETQWCVSRGNYGETISGSTKALMDKAGCREREQRLSKKSREHKQTFWRKRSEITSPRLTAGRNQVLLKSENL